MQIIEKYFPDLTQKQKDQIAQLKELYTFWNSQINVISRKDIDLLYERHVLHSLSIAKAFSFVPSTTIADVGTGGGFPGIPLAILFPGVQFTLVDSIAKKIKVVTEVKTALGLNNVVPVCERIEKMSWRFEFIVSRAVAPMPEFEAMVRKQIAAAGRNSFANGIIALKGGELEEELKPFEGRVNVIPLSGMFEEEYYETKKIIYLQAGPRGI